MIFKKYTKIKQFKDVIRDITYMSNFKGLDENDEPIYENSKKPILTFTGTVKLHGTNAGICYTPEKGVFAQKRSSLLKLENIVSHFEFNTFVQITNQQYFIDLMSNLYKQHNLSENEELIMFGEWAGKGIQKGVGISLLSKAFYVFGLMKYNMDTDENTWLDFEDLKFEADNVYNINEFPTYKMEIDFNKPALSQQKLIDITMKVEKDCPVSRQLLGKEYEDELIGEGIVWESFWKKQRFVFKVKGPKHSTSKVTKLASVDPEVVQSIYDFVEYACTKNRIEQGIQETGATEKKDTPNLLRWVANDIIKEENDTLLANNLEWKQVAREVSNRVRQYFFEIIDKI